MITTEALEKLATQYQMGVFPNIVREYFQHLFLSELYKLPESEKVLFKGGTALRIIYGSPRFSEDLDFSVFGIDDVKHFVESFFIKVLHEAEKTGIKIELNEKIGPTSGGYFGSATFKIMDYSPVTVEINVSSRNGRSVIGEADTVFNNFVPTYTVIHLPQNELVEEKIFGALVERKKPRDFYDLYFMMRNRMLSLEHKKRLNEIQEIILKESSRVDFRNELGVFLPFDQQTIARDFQRALKSEMERQLSSV